MIELRYEGLRQLAQALRIVDAELYASMVAGLKEVGEVIRRDARSKFIDYGAGVRPLGQRAAYSSEGRAASFVKAADGFQTLVRVNTSTMALVSVGQTNRSSRDLLRRRRNFGDLMMRHGLLPAREESMEQAATVLEESIGTLLTTHGF